MITADASEAMARFCHAHLALLDAEQANEAAYSTASLQHLGKKQLERRALAVCQLQITGSRTGFGGKVLLELERAAGTASKDPDAGGRVPISQILRSGDFVRVERQLSGSASKKLLVEATAQAVQGVVTKAQENSLVIALSQEETETPPQGTPVWCVKLANTVTYERMRRQIQDLLKQADRLDEAGNLVRVLIQGEEPAAVDQEDLDTAIQFFDEGLNTPQQQAAKHALAAPELALIHGPPGTGKTSTLVEIIRHLVARGLRPLVCAPSNIAVDNLAERLATAGVPLIRIGHPARLLPAVVDHALDVVVAQSDNAALVRDLRNELDGNLQQMAKVKLGRHAPVNGPAAGGKDKKRALYLANKDLRRDLRQRERVCVTHVLNEASVVLATLHGAGSRVLSSQRFDVVVIDEAAQALEPQCWIAMRRAKKVILAGDPLQLPPVIKTDDVAGMLKAYHAQAQTGRAEQTENKAPVPLLTGATPEATLLGRLLNRFGKQEQNRRIVSFLSVQYRMHADICRFPSQELYEGRLVPPDTSTSTVGVHLLRDLPGVRDTDETSVPLVFIDTQGFDLFEEVEDDPTASKANRAECDLIKTHVDRLLDAGVPVGEMAVLTPYSAQVACLADVFFNRDDTGKGKSTNRDYTGLEIGTVDGMQGREKEAVLLTLVRSQPSAHHAYTDGKSQTAGVGFLKEARRLNVAMTRARRHLAVVGDAETVGAGGGFLARWMTFLSEQGDLRFPEM